MNPFDKEQIKIAKATLKMSDVGAFCMGGLTKPEAVLMLKQSGMTVTKISELLVASGHTSQEIGKLFIDAIRMR